MAKPERHVFVCLNTRPPGHPQASCGASGANDLLPLFYDELENRNLAGKVAVTGTTCMGPCDWGPTVVVYPDGTWYGRVRPNDVSEIVEKHFIDGEPVTRLLMPEQIWG